MSEEEKLKKMLTDVCYMIESVNKIDVYCSKELKEWWQKHKSSRSSTDRATFS